MALFSYSKQVRRFLNDGNMRDVDEENLVSYINRARREVAMRTQAIRFVTSISGQITAANVTAAGSGYTRPTVVISPPDFPPGTLPYPSGAQATAVASVTGGQISGVQITFGGAGYFNPTITITDPTGTGAAVSAVLTPINSANYYQEVYPFNLIDLSNFPGVSSILFVRSVSIIYANYRYSLPKYSFSAYQAKVRNYPFQYVYVPTIFCQVGQGINGTLYMYPMPSQTYQMEWDCTGVPADLTNDFDVEAIPEPFTEAVPYFAAHLAYLQLQNFNAAKFYEEMYDKMALRYASYSRVGRAVNPYGRP